MRYLALGVVLLMATPVFAQQEPEHLSDYVFIHDIHEHKVIVSAYPGFTDNDRGYNNLQDWAQWACQFYRRNAVGPLSHRQANTQACGIVNSWNPQGKRGPEYLEARNACQVFHLFACAIR